MLPAIGSQEILSTSTKYYHISAVVGSKGILGTKYNQTSTVIESKGILG